MRSDQSYLIVKIGRISLYKMPRREKGKLCNETQKKKIEKTHVFEGVLLFSYQIRKHVGRQGTKYKYITQLYTKH